MAEQFLEEIYADAKVIDDFRESIAYIARTDYDNARLALNRGMDQLEHILGKYAEENPTAANKIQNCALDIINKWGDWSYLSGRLRGILIPLIYEYMSLFTSIDVEDGNYLLQSSDSGFLTLKDLEENEFLHDIHDPMQEAGDIADMLLNPWIEEYVIFGCGLGYLPYKLWKKTGEAAKIIIYEDNEKIIDYARHYGVLDWIDKNNLDIRCLADYEMTIKEFSKEVDFNNKSRLSYVTPYKKKKYKFAFDGQFLALVYRIEYFWVSRGVNETNYWKNRQLNFISLNDMRNKLHGDSWIVVAAGPSLNYSMDFIKDNAEENKIVAVNTVLRRCFKERVIPDLSVAADPFGQIPEHLEGIEEFTTNIPMIADWLLCWKYSYKYRGEKCFVPTPATQNLDRINFEKADVWDVYGTVSAMAIEAAIRLGAKKIYLVGLDLAFPGGNVHAKEMPHDKIAYKHEAIMVPSMSGGMVETTPVFNDFRLGVEEIISRNPKVEFINMSRDGAVIKGAKPGLE